MCDNLAKRVILTIYISCCDIMIMSCSHCIQHSVEYQVFQDSKKCSKCVCHDMCCDADDSELSN